MGQGIMGVFERPAERVDIFAAGKAAQAHSDGPVYGFRVQTNGFQHMQAELFDT